MNTAAQRKRTGEVKDYGPKKPAILHMMEKISRNPRSEEKLVEKVGEFCAIVDRPAIRLVGIRVPVSFESQGYPAEGQMSDGNIVRKYITDGTVAFLAETLGICLQNTEIVSARCQVSGDGNYDVIVGVPVDGQIKLPEFLPEHTVEWMLPACRYAKMTVNEGGKAGREGFPERMAADEYFIGDFRSTAGYVYEDGGYPMNTWDETGDLLTKYEPVRKPEREEERFASMELSPVLLPPMHIVCCSRPHGDEEWRCISDFFEREDKVFAADATRYYRNRDFYGFPVDWEGSYRSCYGCRVSSFEGLPEEMEKITLPGGKYIHITQKEFNGDNPSMLYEAAFGHMEQLYFREHDGYEFDPGRKVIARFRQSNCASVFVPVRPRG